jgi:hypothetical protein
MQSLSQKVHNKIIKIESSPTKELYKMPILFFAFFIAMAIAFPQLMRFTVVGPILAFSFGGLFWALGGFFNLASFSFSSFLLYFTIAYVVVIYMTSK